MKKETKEVKKFSLSKEETNNIIGRERAMDYLLDIIKRDINIYLYTEVVKRLGLPQDGKYKLSADRTWFEIDEPNG